MTRTIAWTGVTKTTSSARSILLKLSWLMRHGTFDLIKEILDTGPQANGTSLEPFVKTRCGDNEFHCNQGDRYLESV